MKERTIKREIIKFISNYFSFFLLVAFVITCCTTLFISTLSETLSIELNRENLGRAAKLTFLNVAVISLIFTIIDRVRRMLTIDKPVKLISDATDRMVKGDFNVKIPRDGRTQMS